MTILDNITDSLSAAMLLIDSEHRIQWMNGKAQEWFGACRIGERRECYRTSSLGPSFCVICPTGKAIDCATPALYEFTRPCNGSSRNFEVIALPVGAGKDSRPSSVLEIVMDVTEKGLVRTKEYELMAQIEKMVAVGQLAAGVGHELNTPLGTISIISKEINRVIDGLALDSAAAKTLNEYLTDMHGEISRCKTIIKDLLDFSRRGLSYFVETDINALVSKTVDFICKGNMAGFMKITKALDPTVPVILTDSSRFRQVLVNVIKNAIEAVEEIEDGRVEISTRLHNKQVCVSIKDNGAGVPPQNLKRVFEPFFTTKPVGKGTGLGLSVSYGIMKDLNGEIKLENKAGRGTKVTLLLPKDQMKTDIVTC